MTPNQFSQTLKQHATAINQLMSRTLPVKAGAIAKAHFQENFRLGGFVDNGFHKWTPAKRLNPKPIKNKKSKTKTPPAANRYGTLLSGRNHLFDSINYRPEQGSVTIYNDVEYAAVHNEGLRAGRGKGFIMPKRRFMGESKELSQKITNLIDTELRNILNS
ncbi:MAG: phage virion morphogenesis protein [Bacteroidales bacterium]|nr:phage virion morphogenesis protein [Bacteroidales bacterium]